MAPQADRQMKIKNISSQNLGTGRPLSLFLRRKPKSKNDKLAYRSEATVAESRIPPEVKAWEKQGLLSITPVKGDKPPSAAPKEAKKSKSKEQKSVKPSSLESDDDEKGSFKGAVTTSSLAADKEAVKEAVEVEEEAPQAKDRVDLESLAPVEDKPSIGSVASAADGSPAVTLPTPPAEAPPAPEADKTYNMAERNAMKVADVREIVKARTLGVRSTQKAMLIGAILAAQSGETTEEAEEATTEE